MPIISRAMLIGERHVIEGLPKSAFKVSSWDNAHSPAAQKVARAYLASLQPPRVIESVYNPMGRNYHGLIWAGPSDRAACYRDLAALQS